MIESQSYNLSPPSEQKFELSSPHFGRHLNLLRRHWRLLALILTPPLLSPLLALGSEQGKCGFLLLLIACYWVLQLLPLSLTALLPFLLAPLLRLGTSESLARSYFPDIQFLFIGGVVLSVAMEDTGLSRRLALKIVARLGTQPRWLLLGFMLPSWLLSMWMSNTGTTILMFPFVMAAIAETEKASEHIDASNGDGDSTELEAKKTGVVDVEKAAEHDPSTKASDIDGSRCKKARGHAVCYCLSVAYACNVGGVATLIGTLTNLVLVGQLKEIYSVSNVITFSNWIAFSLPLSTLSLLVIWFMLQLVFLGPRETFRCRALSPEQQQRELRIRQHFLGCLKDLGPMSSAEWVTFSAFPCVLLLLMTGKLTNTFGWHYLFGKINGSPVVSDSTGMIAIAVLLLLAPNPHADSSEQPNILGYRPVVRWARVVKTIPFDIILLIGGGLAIAKLTKDSKLSEMIGSALTPALRSLPIELTLFVLCFCVIWLTEVTSNMAAASVLLPIVAQIAACLGLNPLLFMVTLTITCSYAFCLPTATPPNAIVFSSGRITIPQMGKAGLILNLTFAVIVPFYTLLMGRWVYSIHEIPEWAKSSVCTNQTLNG